MTSFTFIFAMLGIAHFTVPVQLAEENNQCSPNATLPSCTEYSRPCVSCTKSEQCCCEFSKQIVEMVCSEHGNKSYFNSYDKKTGIPLCKGRESENNHLVKTHGEKLCTAADGSSRFFKYELTPTGEKAKNISCADFEVDCIRCFESTTCWCETTQKPVPITCDYITPTNRFLETYDGRLGFSLCPSEREVRLGLRKILDDECMGQGDEHETPMFKCSRLGSCQEVTLSCDLWSTIIITIISTMIVIILVIIVAAPIIRCINKLRNITNMLTRREVYAEEVSLGQATTGNKYQKVASCHDSSVDAPSCGEELDKVDTKIGRTNLHIPHNPPYTSKLNYS